MFKLNAIFKVALVNTTWIWLISISLCILLTNQGYTQDRLWGLTTTAGPGGGGTIFSMANDESTYTVHKSFQKEPSQPYGSLLQCSNGNFYGITREGGNSGGIIFKISHDGTGFTVIHSFNDYKEGSQPGENLIEGVDGNLYGLTNAGGINEYGTVFKINPDGTGFTLLHHFTASEGQPVGSLTQDSDGKLYGLTRGIYSSYGKIFKINRDGTGFLVIKTFNYDDRIIPNGSGSLVQGRDGYLYGYGRRYSGSLIIFKVAPDGSNFTLVDHHTYTGEYPNYSLIQGRDGYLYGMSKYGDINKDGTIFKVKPDGTGFSLLKSFNKATDGADPNGSLIQGSDGYLYGMTPTGGANNYGTLFKIKPDGTGFSVLKNFNLSDGANPYGGLVQGVDGNLYGMATKGGINDHGTLFKIKPDGTGFSVLKGLGTNSEGTSPSGSLTQDQNGNFYGTTLWGGINGYGTIFKITTSGKGFSVLKSFNAATDGANPNGSLTRAIDGSLYGLTKSGGVNGYGTIFKINPDGSKFTLLHHFAGSYGGGYPAGSLIQGVDGNLYGMTTNGGINDHGTIFKINRDGTGFTVLKSFNRATDGAHPAGSLIQGVDGSLYGMTKSGGPNNYGNIFKIKPDGTFFLVLKSFNIATDSAYPVGSLIQGVDGNLYGMTTDAQSGTIFTISPDGSKFSILKKFEFDSHYEYYMYGRYPAGSLIQGVDGSLYGMTQTGGYYENGNIFKINPDGTGFSVLKNFNISDGTNPYGSLIIQSKSNTVTCSATGSILREKWVNVPGYSVGVIPVNTSPTSSAQLTSFETTSNTGDNYGERIRGYVCAPYSGNYTFYIAGDDQCELYLSSDEDPAKKTKIASVATYSGNKEWNKFPSQKSIAIALVAGKKYYIEALHKEASGDDHLAVGWQTPASAAITLIAGSYLSPFIASCSNVAQSSLVVNPSSGGILSGTTLYLKTIPGASSYTLQVSTSSDFTTGVITKTTASRLSTGTYYAAFPELSLNQKYYVRVYTNLGLCWGPVTSFTTASAAGSAYVTNPSDGGTTTGTSLYLNTVPGATSYTLQVSTSADFTTGLITRTTASRLSTGTYYAVFPEFLPNQKYYVRVKTNLSDIWGRTTSFTTASAAGSAFVSNPSDGSTTTGTSLYLNTVPGATSYTLQVSTSSDFTTSLITRTTASRLSTGTYYAVFPELSLNQKYYVRVKTNLSQVWGRTTSFTKVSATARLAASEQSAAESLESKVSIYPNPFETTLTLSTTRTGTIYITVVDNLGRVVFQSTTQGTQTELNLSHLKAGVYIVKVSAEDGSTQVVRVIKK